MEGATRIQIKTNFTHLPIRSRLLLYVHSGSSGGSGATGVLTNASAEKSGGKNDWPMPESPVLKGEFMFKERPCSAGILELFLDPCISYPNPFELSHLIENYPTAANTVTQINPGHNKTRTHIPNH